MSEEPVVIGREAVSYVAITANVTMTNLGEAVPPLTREVRDWLRSRGIEPADAPFWKYNVIDMERGLEIEAGFPVAEPIEGDGRIHAGVLPAGRYATVLHIGHPRTLIGATGRLLQWGGEHGLTWDSAPGPTGERWGCRLEIYRDEPGQDMNEWPTELAFRLAD